MTKLLINIDHIATLRNARGETFPDPVRAAAVCEMAGAHGVVFHLREDRRHIREADVRELKQIVSGKLDFEVALNQPEIDICVDVGPHLATLVPERREELTTEGGLDVPANSSRLGDVIPQLHEAGIEVALFVDADPRQVEASRAVGADAIELHTGDYANAVEGDRIARLLEQHARAAELAHELGLDVHAGHGLNYTNLAPFLRAVSNVQEVSIGFAIIAEALFKGLHMAVRDMLTVIRSVPGTK
jgi:pyridoxine 5-phosphate synthase